MTWILTDKEIEALLAADGKRRYEYFIHRVCDTRTVWGLYHDGWASLGDGDRQLIPFWPHEKFAMLFQAEEWNAYAPQAIALDAFLERWIPGMQKEGIDPAIFPTPAGSAVIVSLADLEAHLRHELAEFYGEED